MISVRMTLHFQQNSKLILKLFVFSIYGWYKNRFDGWSKQTKLESFIVLKKNDIFLWKFEQGSSYKSSYY